MIMILLESIDILLFIACTLTALYLLFYSVAAFSKRKDTYQSTKVRNRFAILIPAYKDDNYILSTVRSIMRQDYPIDCYEIVVIADHLYPDTILHLSQLPIILIQANFKNSSKTKALKAATAVLKEDNYDIAVILNADNITDTDFLNKMNETFESGSTAIQSHRIRQERSTNISVIDAITDEINNTINRLGHSAVGLSASLNGSGMAFDYEWFNKNINKLSDNENEKCLESLLLNDGIFIDYLDNTNIYATKVENVSKFYTQRKTWIISNYILFFKNIKNLPGALFRGNMDLADRIIQWGTFPISILLSISVCFCILLTYFNWVLSIKWGILFLISLFSMALATPDYLVDQKFSKAMKALPFIVLNLFLNSVFKRK